MSRDVNINGGILDHKEPTYQKMVQNKLLPNSEI